MVGQMDWSTDATKRLSLHPRMTSTGLGVKSFRWMSVTSKVPSPPGTLTVIVIGIALENFVWHQPRKVT